MNFRTKEKDLDEVCGGVLMTDGPNFQISFNSLYEEEKTSFP